MSRFSTATIKVILLLPFSNLAIGAIAQSQPATTGEIKNIDPKFDVVAIHEVRVPLGGTLEVSALNPSDSSRYIGRNITAKDLITSAYDLADYQIIGGPKWVDSTLFFVQAQSDLASDEKLKSMDPQAALSYKRRMLQAILSDRFAMRYHLSTVKHSVQLLTVDDHGLRLQAIKKKQLNAAERPGWTINGDEYGFHIVAVQQTMHDLATLLAHQSNRPMVDEIDDHAKYDFSLEYDPSVLGDDTQTRQKLPSLPVALREQLGLRIKSTKGNIEILVIDSIAKPSEN